MYNKIPKNWEKVKLKKYIEIVRGVNYKSNEVYDYKNDNTTGILRANNISNNGMFNFEKIIYVDNKNIKNEQMIKNGDIVIAMSSGSKNLVGKAAQAKQNLNFAFGAFCSVVRPKNINSDFLGFYFLTDYYRNKISELSTGININNLRKDYIENLDIMVPLDPKEQEKIVQVLDTMSNIIRLREKCISHAQDLIPALFQEMFKPYANYTKTALNNLFEFKSGGTPSKQVEEYFQGDIPWITTVALNKLFIGKEDANELITEEAIQKSATKLIPANSLLFGTRVGIGKLAINTVPMCANQDIVAMIPFENNNLNLVYAYWYLKQINNFFVANGRGATIQGITTHLVRSTEIILPPLKVQEQFAQKVIEIESYIKEQQEELENAKQMFQSLLHHAFTGELTRRAYGKI